MCDNCNKIFIVSDLDVSSEAAIVLKMIEEFTSFNNCVTLT